MKQLILLAGLHKTATTSIQRTCAANQRELFQAGFAYPTLASPGDAGGSNHTTILNWFRHDPASAGLMGQYKWATAPLGDGAAFLAGFARSLDKLPDHLLMAAEGVSLFSAQELEGMKAWFAERGWEIRVMCHVRHLSGWMNSMIAQRVTSAICLSIGQAVEEYRQYQSVVRRRIETVRQVFPQADFYSYEQAARHRAGPAGFFLDNAGVHLFSPLRVVRANEGGSDSATRVLSLVNERFGRFEDSGKLNGKFFGDRAFIDSVRRIAGPKFTLRPAEAAPILQLLQADNDWLRATFGDAFHDERLQFDEAPAGWTPEGLTQLQAALATATAPVRDWVASNLPRIGLQPPPR